ncbi:MAG: redoxin domain-containing protein [Verrucomicrobiota bacterium]
MADFQRKLSQFTEKGVRVIGASSETLEEATATVEKLGLEFPVGYGLDPETFAETFAAYYSDDSTYLHATGFLIDPEGEVDIAVYSSGAIGRFTADDALHILEYRLKDDSQS